MRARRLAICDQLQGGSWVWALSLPAEMRERGVAPKVISFSTGMSSCKWVRALLLLDEKRKHFQM